MSYAKGIGAVLVIGAAITGTYHYGNQAEEEVKIEDFNFSITGEDVIIEDEKEVKVDSIFKEAVFKINTTEISPGFKLFKKKNELVVEEETFPTYYVQPQQQRTYRRIFPVRGYFYRRR